MQTGGSAGVASAALPLMVVGLGVAGAASNEMNLGLADWRTQPMALVEAARRSLFVDPVAEMTATLTAIPRMGLLTPAAVELLPKR